MGNPMSFLWARPLFTVFIIHAYYHRCTIFDALCPTCVCVCVSVRIGHLIEALNFSVIVHKSRKYATTHIRALFTMTSIFNRVFGANSEHERKHAHSTQMDDAQRRTIYPPTWQMRTKNTPQWCIDAKLIHNAVCCLPRLLSFHFYYLLFDESQIRFVFVFQMRNIHLEIYHVAIFLTSQSWWKKRGCSNWLL